MKTQRSTLTKWSLNAGLVLGLALVVLLVLVAPSQARVATATDANAITNPGFESGKAPWICRNCSFSTGAPVHSGSASAQFTSTKPTGRLELIQKNISLQPNTQYEITFWARSDGSNLQVDLQRQLSPFTNFGLNKTFDVTTEWQQFSLTFTTKGFSNPISNARIRFRSPRGAGFEYSLDDVSLSTEGGPPPGPTSTPPPGNPTATPPPPGPTATPPPSNGSGQLVFRWTDPVTEAEKGFPWDKPPKGFANSNWKLPPGYDKGTLHFRAEVKSARAPRIDLKVQFCIWQDKSKLENCTRAYRLDDVEGSVVEFSVPVQNLWKKNGVIIDWSRPRDRNGIAIKDLNGVPCSSYSNFNWCNRDPKDLYPADIDFEVRVTAPGQQFAGWDNITD